MNLLNFYAQQNKGYRLRLFLLSLYTLAVFVYFSWRFTVFNTDNPVFSTLFLTAEIASLILAFMSIKIMWKVKVRLPISAPTGLKVDVFVPTYNESAPLVRRTVIAAQNIDYPHETWLLDDTDRPEMKALAADLGCHYLRRDNNQGAKSGNLNNALKFAKGDFIAVIDCDHIAQVDYLDRLLGYFDEDDVAFVQAPQDYYNTNAYQFRNNKKFGLLWHDQTGFFAAGQAGRDYGGATTCCGTSTIVRRRVIEEIGGFPEETVTEDIHVAIKAQKLGYKSAYYPLPLAYGVAPVDLGEFHRQRLRWGQGNVQSVREEGLPFTRKLSFAQNIGYSYLAFLYAEGWARLVFYMAPPVVIFTGLMPIAPTHDFLWYFLPFFIVTAWFFEQLGRGDNRFHVNEEMAMARFPVFIASTFAIFRQRIKWVISSKEFIGHFQPYTLFPQLIVLVLNSTAAVWAFVSPNAKLLTDYSPAMLVFGAMWCVFNSFLAIKVISNAVRCAKNKRADFRFELALPIEVSIDEGVRLDAQTVKLSSAGMSFTFNKNIPITADSKITGTLYLPGLKLNFSALIEAIHTGSSSLIHCNFDQLNQTSIDTIDMSLHACVWHRKLVWDGGYFLTPIEWLATRIGLREEDRKTMFSNQAILLNSDKDPSPRLALYLGEIKNRHHSLLSFEAFSLGEELSFKNIDNAQQKIPAHVKIQELITPGEVASAGPNRVKMYHYSVTEKI